MRPGARTVAVALCFSCALIAQPALAQEDDLDAILGGFDDEDAGYEAPEPASETKARWWDLSGSVDVSASVAYLDHDSVTGNDYTGLQRLRNRLDLQLDIDIPMLRAEEDAPREPSGWKIRVGGYGFWDAAYLINGRGGYTDEVLDDYELDADVSEAWIAGSPHPRIDLKIGRQIVGWGRSETLQVLDLLNPLDNREPGRADLEDLRLPVAMLRADTFAGPWTLSLLVIPEIRAADLPAFGSDFNPITPALAPIALDTDKPGDFETVELAAGLTGIFSRWDVSFHFGWLIDDVPRLQDAGPGFSVAHERYFLLGSGGSYAFGAWIVKGELAWLHDLEFAGVSAPRHRLDLLVGIEYYGLRDTTIALEGLNRHVFAHEAPLLALNGVREDAQEFALRVSRNFWNERLSASAVAFVQRYDASDGSLLRFDISYDLRDALTVSAGLLLYQTGDITPFNEFASNDRLMFGAEWSF